MAITGKDIIAAASLGVFVGMTTGDMPSTPSIALTNGTGQVTVTISGSDAGVTNYVKYRASSHSSWQDGGTRSGDGDVTVTGLDNDVPYVFICYSLDGVASYPSQAKIGTLTASNETDFEEDIEDTALDFMELGAITITYKPSGGDTREILGLVDYNPTEGLGAVPHAHSAMVQVTVKNNSTTGISSAELNTGGDKISLPWPRENDAAQDRRITSPVTQDRGMLTVEVH